MCPGWWLQIACLTLVAGTLVADGAQGISVPPVAARLMLRPEAASLAASPNGGIQYCAFEGHLRKPDNPAWNPEWEGATEPVLLHVWIRAIVVDGKLYARGFTFAQSLIGDKARICQANGAQSFRDNFKGSAYLMPVGAMQPAYRVQVYVEPDRARPNTIAARGAQLEGAQIQDFAAGKLQLQLRFDNFTFVPTNSSGSSGSVGGGGITSTTCVFNVLPLKAHQLSPAEDRMGSRNLKIQMHTRWVVSSLHDASVLDTSTMLHEHTSYHQSLGVISTHLYINTAHSNPKRPRHPRDDDPVGALMKDGRIKEMVDAGNVTLVPWTMQQPPEHGSYSGFYHQLVQYGHAILAGWLEPIYMVMADLDEYVMLPRPATIAQAMVACVPADTAVAINRMQVVDAECLPCRSSFSTGRMRDLDAWRNVSLTQGQSPLLMYTMDNSKRLKAAYGDKQIIDPFFNHSFSMHSANVVPGTTYGPREKGLHIQPDAECIRVMHLKNLFHTRFRLTVDMRRSWWWPLQRNLSTATVGTGG